MSANPYLLLFDIGTIKHLGLQMYSTLPPVIAELVSNAWDADAKTVKITIPIKAVSDSSKIVIEDDGCGMSDSDIRDAYFIVGRDRRKASGDKPTPIHKRRRMGRKGIGKFSAFGIASMIEVETVHKGKSSRFKIEYEKLEAAADSRKIGIPPLSPTGTLKRGTRVTLHGLKKFRSRKISLHDVRRKLARRFSILGSKFKFEILVNGAAITTQERDLRKLLDKGADGKQYIWEYKNHEIKDGTGWTVSGWIGALDRTNQLDDGIQRGISILARGKLVQEPFVFDAVVGQQYALSYLIGELHAEFVDDQEDSISTTRNSLVWDTDANQAFKQWGIAEVNRIAREWAERRSADNERELEQNALYKRFVKESSRFQDSRVRKAATKLIKSVIASNPLADPKQQAPVIQYCIDYVEFDSFQELASEMADTPQLETNQLVRLFREWEIVESREMMRVTEGRITTITKLQYLIDKNALEVPTLHNFLKEFPWVLDPRWTLIDDEVHYSDLLRRQYPEPKGVPESDRRIDFLCVKESNNLIVVEIKRPHAKIGTKELQQIEEYVVFVRDHVKKTTDEELKFADVVGYLLCGDTVNTVQVRGKLDNLKSVRIFVRRYQDLLRMVRRNHQEFLDKYEQLRKAAPGKK